MPDVGHKPLVIGECGFGFGVNFLVTCERFSQLAPVNSTLHFLSCEVHPVLKKDLYRFYKTLPSSLHPYAEQLLENYPEQGQGIHRIMFEYQQHHYILDLLYNDAITAFQKLSTPAPIIDAWYMDGYSPAKNEAMWGRDLCSIIAKLSKPGSTLATYSVAGKVRENLRQAGFNVSKRIGFGKKRQMLVAGMAEYPQTPDPETQSWSNPWTDAEHSVSRIGIIGAGLAGSATAHALALRGYSVSLLEKNAGLASGASGNPHGIVHFNPGRQLTPANLFRLSAFRYAVRHYHHLSKHHDFSWYPCGLIQLAKDNTEFDEYNNLLARQLYDPAFMRLINADQASRLAGLSINHNGLFFPQAGCLDPAALCRAWTSAKNINFLGNREVTEINFNKGQWQVTMNGQHGTEQQEFDVLVICDNGATPRLTQDNGYPVLFNYGQTDSFKLDSALLESDVLKCVVRQKGYVIPWGNKSSARITIGGSFNTQKDLPTQSTTMQEHNLQMLKDIAPSLHEAISTELSNDPNTMSSRPGTRCSTPDYLPLAGPIEENHLTRSIYSDYQRSARKEIVAKPHYFPGLYINIAHGSSGLVTTPLLGEYIASLISRDSLPINKDEISAVLPLRYLVRDLKRQKS